LQVLFFAVLFGVALALVGGEKGERVTKLIDSASAVLFRAMGLIVRVAPLGVLGAVAYTVGKYGVGSLKQLVSLVGLFYVAVKYAEIPRLHARGIDHRARHRVLGCGAAADHAQARAHGREGFRGRLVIPTGYSFNLDAFSIYLTLAVVFIAQATNTPLSLGDLLLVLGVSLVTSKGAHGVPGSAIVILAATLNAVPSIPAIGLVLSVDRSSAWRGRSAI
jgi:aerobic C4-dicarboxylate transport protein